MPTPTAFRPETKNLHRLAAAALALTTCLSALSGCRGDDDGALTVTLTLPRTPVGFAKGTILVDYTRAGARMLAEGGGPACALILPGLDGDFSDDGRGVLTIHVGSKRGLRGPADIAACRMKSGDPEATSQTLASQITMKIAEAEDGAGKPVDLTAKPAKAHATNGESKTLAANNQVEPGGTAPRAGDAIGIAGAAKTSAAPGSATPPAVPPVAPASAANVKPDTSANSPAPPTPPPARPQPAPPSTPSGRGAAKGDAAGAGNQDPSVAEDDPGEAPNNSVKDPTYDDSVGDDSTAPEYDIDISVSSASELGALQLEIVHLGSTGSWVGRGAKVDCGATIDALLAANFVGGRGVKIALINLDGIPTPGSVVRCGFRTHERLSPASFQVRIVDAADSESQAVTPLPDVVVSSIVRR